MKKLKNFLYPLLFSFSFIFTYTVPLYIIVEMTDTDGYGGLGLALLFIFAWAFLVLPFYCIRYSKLIVDERFKFLFAIYNGAVLSPIHLIPFNLEGEEQIIVAFYLWVALWSFLPLCLRLISRKDSEKISNSADTCSFLLQSKIKNTIAVCTTLPYISILLADFSALQIFELDNLMFYTLPCVSAVLVLAFVLSKNKRYLFKNRMLTFALAGELISGLYSVIFFASSVRSYISIALLAVMLCGTLFDFKYVNLLRYGALGYALLRLGWLTIEFTDREGMLYLPAELTDDLTVNTDIVIQFLIVLLYFTGMFLLATNKRTNK